MKKVMRVLFCVILSLVMVFPVSGMAETTEKEVVTRSGLCSRCSAYAVEFCSYHDMGMDATIGGTTTHSYGLGKTCIKQLYTSSVYLKCTTCLYSILVATGHWCHEYHLNCGRGEVSCCVTN